MRLSLAEERIASASIKGLRYVAGTPKDGDREEPMEHQASRRDLLLTSLTAALPFGIPSAAASPLNPEQTIIKPPDALEWKTLPEPLRVDRRLFRLSHAAMAGSSSMA
jgi:hypothetical protein